MGMTVYGNILRQLLPPGPAWECHDDSEMADLLDGLAARLAVIEERGGDLLEEFDPRTTTELLPDWERIYGLPGTNPSPPADVTGRRSALWAKMIGSADPTPQFFIDLAAAAGYPGATVTEFSLDVHEPLTCISDCNYSLWQSEPGWPFYWTLTVASGANNAMLTWLVESLVPCHTIADVIYT
jgi:uncharacterized protein YmfQ (DUF2313 family)